MEVLDSRLAGITSLHPVRCSKHKAWDGPRLDDSFTWMLWLSGCKKSAQSEVGCCFVGRAEMTNVLFFTSIPSRFFLFRTTSSAQTQQGHLRGSWLFYMLFWTISCLYTQPHLCPERFFTYKVLGATSDLQVSYPTFSFTENVLSEHISRTKKP